MLKVFLASGLPKEKFAVISGIGCSSRIPYYVDSYGFHGIHGRAAPVAMGLKLVQPEQSVWVATGDGDALAIGGNHFIHMMRRNPDIKIILFNNQIYALTKGQTSPTSSLGTKTKSSPHGSPDRPIQPLKTALGSDATFVARAHDSDGELLFNTMEAAFKHKGAAVVEVLVNCVIYNDGAFQKLTDKEARLEHTIKLEAGKPLLFGKNMDKGIIMKDARPQVVTVGPGGVSVNEVLIHDPKNPNSGYAFMLAEMGGNLPVPLGVLRQTQEHVYAPYIGKQTIDGYQNVMRGSSSWKVDNDGKRTSQI